MFTAAFRSIQRRLATIVPGDARLVVYDTGACRRACVPLGRRFALGHATHRVQKRATKAVRTFFARALSCKLAPGWKTYWRYPGDSGVPPHFEFEQSENVKSVAVLWPAPLRFSDAEGTTIGYKDNVVFPLRIEAKDPSKPVTLRLKFDYAVCERLCIPVRGARPSLSIDGKDNASDATVAAAEAARSRSASVSRGSAIGDFERRRRRRVEACARPRRRRLRRRTRRSHCSPKARPRIGRCPCPKPVSGGRYRARQALRDHARRLAAGRERERRGPEDHRRCRRPGH